MKSWKQVKRTRNKKQSSQRFLLGVGFLLVLGLIIGGGRLYLLAKKSQWQGTNDFSVVEQKLDRIKLKTILRNQDKLIIWQVPGNTMVEVAGGYGQYQIKNVFALGELELSGGELLTRSIEENFGLMVEGFVVDKKTNLSWWDQVKRWWFEQFVASEIQELDLQEQASFKKETLADGTEVFVVVKGWLDQLINQEIFTQLISDEELSVTLVNRSGNVLMQDNLARIMVNQGIEVVSKADEDELVDVSFILIKDKQFSDSLTVEWLNRLFDELEVRQLDNDKYWSDIVVVVGKDMIEFNQ